jgi:hypothetical protein
MLPKIANCRRLVPARAALFEQPGIYLLEEQRLK